MTNRLQGPPIDGDLEVWDATNGQWALTQQIPAAAVPPLVAYGPLSPATSGIVYDGNGRVTAFTDAAGNAYSSITRDPTSGLVTSYVLNGTTHTITRNGSNQITGIN